MYLQIAMLLFIASSPCHGALISMSASEALQMALNSTILEQFIEQTNVTPMRFELFQQRTTVMHGRIFYLVKMKIADDGDVDEFCHLRIGRPLPHEPPYAFKLMAFQLGRKERDLLVYFEQSENFQSNPKPTQAKAERAWFRSILNSTIQNEYINASRVDPPMFRLTDLSCDRKVSPMDCLVKVQTNVSEYVHLRIAKWSNSTAKLIAFRRGKSLNDSLQTFEAEAPSTKPPAPATFDGWSEMNSTIARQFALRTNVKPKRFELVNYFTNEGENGTAFFLKVRLSEQEFVHLNVWRPSEPPKSPPTLIAFERGKLANDTLEYFLQESEPETTTASLNETETWSPIFEADVSINLLTQSIRHDFELDVLGGRDPSSVFEALAYRRYIGHGFSFYFIKVVYGSVGDQYAHILVYKAWMRTDPANASPLLIGIDTNKTLDDVLEIQNANKASSLGLFGHDEPTLSESVIATPETQSLLDSILPDFLLRGPQSVVASSFVAISERFVLKNPAIRFIKVQIGPDVFIHVKIVTIDQLQQSRLLAFQPSKSLFDPLDYF